MAGEKDRLQAAQSTNRDVPATKPGAKQDCSDVVNISLFFDGTGNNKDVDEAKKKWANPARMYAAALMYSDPRKGNHAFYISGVGTPYNGDATGWLDRAIVSVQDNAPGGFGGAGGTRRISFGEGNVNDALREALLSGAKKLNATTRAYAEQNKKTSLDDLSKALAQHRLIKMINLSVFGFSRGAALARAFSNDFLARCDRDTTGQLTYQNIPIRIHFMGLFDTVASFGGPAVNVDGPFFERNLRVPGAVERCVHFIAGQELRFSFPVDLIRQQGKLMPNWTETVYPGVHSDVGGGYQPVEQRRSNNYARIPMRDMMNEAVKAGVRMPGYDDLAKINAPLFDERYVIQSDTQTAFQRYMSTVGANGTVEQQMITHMKALYSAYGTMSRKGIWTPDHQEAAAGKIVGHASMEHEVRQYRDQVKLRTMGQDAVLFITELYGQKVQPHQWQLQAWDTTASDDILGFVSKYVHDSKAGFLYGVEPFSYFRLREVAESSRNVMAAGMQWLDDNAGKVVDSVVKVYYEGKVIVAETWKAGVKEATRSYAVGEKFVVKKIEAGEKYAVEVYQTSQRVVVQMIDAGQNAIITSFDSVKKEAQSAVESAMQNAASAAIVY